MPIYEYECENEHRTERLQSLSEEPLRICEICGAPCERVLSPPQIRFIGSGFHNTDYGTKKRGRTETGSADGGATAGAVQDEAKGAAKGASKGASKTGSE